MLHRTPRRRRSLTLCILLVVLLGAHLPHRAVPITAAQGSLTANPSAVTFAVPLGARATQLITITNSTAGTVMPLIYEALPAPPPAALSGQAAPGGPLRVALPQQADVLDPQLLHTFATARDGGKADFIIYLRDQADLSAAYRIRDWAERGRYVYQTLVEWAARSQRGLREQLSTRGLPYRSFWIANAVLAHGTLADAQTVAGRADVAFVRANRLLALAPDVDPPQVPDARCSPDQPDNLTCWNIRKVGADRVWRDFGVTGQGVVVANIDTGVSYAHPALRAQYRGFLGPGRYDHTYNWFDPQGTQAEPVDPGGHGTHTMGTMVAAGSPGAGRPAVGIAPGARWIAAQGCDSSMCSESDLIAAAQWVLAPTKPDGTQPRPDLRAMVVNNSWSGPGGEDWYAGYTAAWRAAGIFPVFAAGNADATTPQKCGSIHSPADYAGVVAVGATESTDTIAPFSLLGPTLDQRVKPDFVAPGTYSGYRQGILSTAPGGEGRYQTLQGTSMAAPHVAGVVALIWSANPTLIGDYEATYGILRDSALHLSDTRCNDPAGAPNNVYGHGRVDAYAAVARARVDVPWLELSVAQEIVAGGSAGLAVTVDARRVTGPGSYRARLLLFGATLSDPPTTVDVTMDVSAPAAAAVISGQVRSAGTGEPVQALVGVKGGLSVPTDSAGMYTLTVALDRYDLVASALSFLPEERTITVTGNLRVDFVLQPDQPRLALATTALSTSLAFGGHQALTVPISNTGTQSLYYQVEAPPDLFGIWRSDEPGGPRYNWIDLPPDAPVLPPGDNAYRRVPLGIAFPFYGATLTQTLIASDGMLAFGGAPEYGRPASACLPDDHFQERMLAPFRADLDPGRGGRIRYGTIDGGTTFVVSYEGIPLHDGPPEVTYTFQALLHSDGRVGFQYRRVTPLPNKVSIGVQRSQTDVITIGCGRDLPLHDGLAIELRPQASPSGWMSSNRDARTLLPGASGQISLLLNWIPSFQPYPYRGRLLVTSNDPAQPRIAILVQAELLPEPHRQWLLLVRQQS